MVAILSTLPNENNPALDSSFSIVLSESKAKKCLYSTYHEAKSGFSLQLGITSLVYEVRIRPLLY